MLARFNHCYSFHVCVFTFFPWNLLPITHWNSMTASVKNDGDTVHDSSWLLATFYKHFYSCLHQWNKHPGMVRLWVYTCIIILFNGDEFRNSSTKPTIFDWISAEKLPWCYLCKICSSSVSFALFFILLYSSDAVLPVEPMKLCHTFLGKKHCYFMHTGSRSDFQLERKQNELAKNGKAVMCKRKPDSAIKKQQQQRLPWIWMIYLKPGADHNRLNTVVHSASTPAQNQGANSFFIPHLTPFPSTPCQPPPHTHNLISQGG